jgi:two-component system NtrC family sensor kinase
VSRAALAALTGIERGSLRRRAAGQLVAENHRPALRRLLELAANGESSSDEVDVPRGDGTPLPCEVAAAPAEGDAGPVVLLVLRDVRRRREAEEEIHGLYREFALLHLIRERIGTTNEPRSIAEHVLEALFKILDRNVGGALYLNLGDEERLELAARRRLPPEAIAALGGEHPPDGMLQAVMRSRRVRRIDDPESIDTELAHEVSSLGVRGVLMLPVRSPSTVHGVMVLVSFEERAFSGSDADLLAAVAAEAGMVIETVKLTERLRGSEARYRRMIEGSPLGILEVAVEGGEILWANHSAERILRAEEDTLAGRRMDDFYRSTDERELLFSEADEEGILRDRPIEMRAADGETIYVSMTSRRVPASPGRPERFEDVIRDITEERELQEQLLRTEKLASLGQMISGIAHELNNPLTGVLGYAQLLQESDLPPMLQDDIEKINTDAMRCKRIIENLMRFARKEKPQRGVVNVNEEIEAVLELRRYQLKVADIEVVRNLDPKLPYTLADPHQLQQVFLNLINNAVDAMKEARGEGTLTVRSAVVGGRIHITVGDDGPGIPPDTLARIFDPFYTTKEVGKGTGLGLSVSYGIIGEHGGEITAESAIGAGTVFTIALPVERIGAPGKRRRTTTRRLRAGGRGRRILVIDDEPSVLAVTQRCLDDDDYRTVGVTSVDAALAQIAEHEFDAVVTDLAMPGKSGKDLIVHLRDEDPQLARRTVVLTGNVLDLNAVEELDGEGVPHLTKPFRVRELRGLLRRVFDDF